MADDDISWEAPKEDISWHSDAEPADHGLSQRQKLSPVGKALSPITGYWDTYQRMRNEAYDQARTGLKQMANPDSLIDPKAHGIQDVATGAANTALGGFNYLVGSPINAAYRSVVGQPLEDTTGIPREYTEMAAQLATPGLGFTKMPIKPGTVADAGAVARATGNPGAVAGVADGTAPRIRTIDGPELNTERAQANRALGDEFDIPYTRGQATEDPGAIRFEDMAARGAYGDEMQGIAKPAFDDQFEAIQRAGQRVGQTVSRGEQPLNTPADAAASLNTEIGDRAAAARTARDAEVGAAEQDAQRLRSGVQEGEINIGREIAGQNPMLENPRQAGEVVSNALRETAANRRADFRERYREFGQMEGDIPVDQVRGMGTRIREDLSHSEQPVVIDDHLTPAASRALQMLDTQSATPTIQNRAAPRAVQTPDTQISGVTIQGIDRMRRHLVAFYKAAERGSEDQRAVRGIMNSFDQQVEAAVSDGLFRGDPRALDVLRRARASYSQYQREFHPQGAGDDVGTAMRRIVERNATPEETANMILGSGKIGQAGLPVRIADRLEQILGNQSESWSAVRQAIWQKASQVRSGAAGEIDAARSARSIQEFTGSTLARRMFSPEELTSMRNHAQASRDLEGIIEATSTARANRAQDVYQQAFGTEGLSGSQKQVFQRMVEGTAQPEEITQSLFGVISGGNPANASRAIAAVERIVGADSPVMGTVRQGVWQKLTQNPFGKDPQGQQKLVQGINEFLNGKGKTISQQLYSPEERALMQRYSEAVRRTIINKYSRTNSDTAVATGATAQKQAQHRVGAIASTLMSMLHMGPVAHMGGNLVARKIGEIAGRAANARSAQGLRDSVNDVVPPSPPMTRGRPQRAPSTIRPITLPRQRDDRRKDGGRIRRAEGGAAGDDYNTSVPDELAFQDWKVKNAPRDSGADYDLRGAYLANMQRADNGHMGDRFKKPNHPTFSDQSQYAVGDQRGRAGSWAGDVFIPPTPYNYGGKVQRK